MTGFRNMDRSSFDKGLCDVFVEYTSGAAGAIPAALTYGKGIASVVRNSAGNITVNLANGYLGLAGIRGSVVQATPSTATGFLVVPNATAVGAATPSVTFSILGQDASTKALAETDTTTGDVVRFELVLRRM